MSEESKVNVLNDHKDRLFKIIFQEKEKLLNLYNALAGTSYQDSSQLEVNTMEDAIYIGMKNDLSFILDGRMNLFEQQSTATPNMPLRGLFYIADLYKQKYYSSKIYMTRLIQIPTPQFIVFYNGSQEMPDRWDLRLSDAYEQSVNEPDLEVIAHMVNINVGHNQELLENCKDLLEYSMFNQRIRENIELGFTKKAAIIRAVDSCIKDGILVEILRKERDKIMGTILAEFDEVGYAQGLREEGQIYKLIEMICKKLRKNKNPQQIAEELEEELAVVENICRLATKFAPDYDVDKVFYEWAIRG